MKDDYTPITDPQWHTLVLHRAGKGFNREDMVLCLFEHTFGMITTAREVMSGKQVVGRTRDFYTKKATVIRDAKSYALYMQQLGSKTT